MRHRRPSAPAGHRAAPPEERSLTDPRFVGSFPRADVTLDPPLPEVAFLGRSNVGKSSLLNALVGRTLARVSATPGKTRALNAFEIDGAYYLIDLPGYGYARASKAERAGFRPLLEGTLNRATLSGVVWLLDIRHDLSKEDREIRDLLSGRSEERRVGKECRCRREAYR